MNAAVERTTTGSPAERFTSRDPEAFAVPTGREEDWRFTPIRKLRPFFTAFQPNAVIESENSVPTGVTVALTLLIAAPPPCSPIGCSAVPSRPR